MVTKIVDSDTIDVHLDSAEQRARLIPVGSPITFERGVFETDRFGRLLRYVYLPAARWVNEAMVAEGFGALSTDPPDVKYEERMRAAQLKDSNRERWDIPVVSAVGQSVFLSPLLVQLAYRLTWHRPLG